MTTSTPTAGYEALRGACGLVDRSERGKLALTGPGAAEFLQGQITNDVLSLQPGSGAYAAFLTPKGKMLGDLRALVAEDELLLDTERVCLQPLFNLIRAFSVGYQVELHKRTLENGLLSLIGPDSCAVAGVTDLVAEPEHAHRRTALAGTQVRAIRTDVGIDLICPAEKTAAVSAHLIDAGAASGTEDDAETLRVEQGRPRYGLDLDQSVIPQEAALNERAVSFTKGCYVGQETVARLYYRGKPNRHLRGLLISGPADTGDEIDFGDRSVGRLGSVVDSPRFGLIALALVRREAEPGAAVAVGSQATAGTVVALPFS